MIKRILLCMFVILAVLLTTFSAFVLLNGAKPYAVVTDSMSPEIKKGSAVFVKTVSASELEPGDIITVSFPNGNGVFTHRLISVNMDEGKIITRGDRNLSNDPESELSSLVGRVWFHLPFAGYPSIIMNSSWFLPVLAALIILTAAIKIFFNFLKKKNSSEKTM